MAKSELVEIAFEFGNGICELSGDGIGGRLSPPGRDVTAFNIANVVRAFGLTSGADIADKSGLPKSKANGAFGTEIGQSEEPGTGMPLGAGMGWGTGEEN